MRGIVAIIVLAGCSSGADPCASFAGQACVSVEVRGLAGTPLDQLHVESTADHTDQLDPMTPHVPPVKTPLEFAYLPQTAGAPFDLTVTGLRNGDALGQGMTTVSVNAGEHRHTTIELSPLTVGGGVDLAGIDLSGVDLSGVDLSGVDLASALDLSRQSSTDLACGPGAPDEDNDGLTDACDPCPIDSSTLDSDFDGVGDSCDPNPTMSGNHILFFDGFSSSGGQKTIGPTDEVAVSVAANDNFRIEVAIHLASPGSEARAGFSVYDAASAVGGVQCVISHSQSSGTDTVIADEFENGVNHPNGQFARFSTTDTTVLRLSRQGSNWICSATVGSDTPVAVSQTFGAPAESVQLLTTQVTTSFDYIIMESVLP